MISQKQYSFRWVENCNMCGTSEKSFKLMGKRLDRSQGLFPSKKVGISVSVLKCKSCGLVFSNPQPIPGDIGDHYNVNPADYWKEGYFKIDPDYFAGEIQWLRKLKPSDDYSGYKSLDIGAGLGKQMIALQKIGFETYGIEPSQTFHKMAIEKMDMNPKRLILTSIEGAQFENDMFDFISFGAVLEHLRNPSNSIAKALSWLKSDGLIHLEVPSSNWLTARIFNLMYRIRGLDYVTNLSPMHPPFHLYEFSLNSFNANGSIQGYSVVDHKYYVCPTYLPSILNPIIRPIMRHTNTGMQLCVWLRKTVP